MKRKQILVLLMALSLCVLFVLPGCILFGITGFVCTGGAISASFNTSPRIIEPESDGTYNTFLKNSNTGEILFTVLAVRNNPFYFIATVIDPIIAQVPADVTNIAATYDNNDGLTGAMIVTAGLQSVTVTPTVNITPEAGHQLVIFDFPDVAGLVPGPDDDASTITVALTATVDPPQAIEVKAISSAKITMDDTDYYLPLFPGVTDFSQVPSFTIPLGQNEQNLEMPTIADLPETPAMMVYDMKFADNDDDGGDDGDDTDDGGDDGGDDDTNTGGGGGGGGGSCFIHSLAR